MTIRERLGEIFAEPHFIIIFNIRIVSFRR